MIMVELPLLMVVMVLAVELVNLTSFSFFNLSGFEWDDLVVIFIANIRVEVGAHSFLINFLSLFGLISFLSLNNL